MDAPRCARAFFFVVADLVLAAAIYPAFSDDLLVWPW
jgi:hypothetical protein